MSDCEKCGKKLEADTPSWKKLCYKCWKYQIVKKDKIGAVFARTGESKYVHNAERKW